MSAELISLLTYCGLLVAIAAGMQFSEKRLSKETKDTVKLATNLVATISALVLGLLVSSAKNSYDAVRGEVIDVSSKVVFLDRMLASYGPEASDARARLRDWTEEVTDRMWPSGKREGADLRANLGTAKAVFLAIQNLVPKGEVQTTAQREALQTVMDIGKIRSSLVLAQSVPSISKLMLGILVSWLVIIFFSFSMLAPTTAPAIISLVISGLSACGALSLIMELDRPFGGLIGISSEPMRSALAQLGQ